MSEQNQYDPSEEDLDMAVEELTGKPINKGTLEQNLAAIKRRIEQLEAERVTFEKALAEGKDVSDFMEGNVTDLKKARELLAGYQAQLGTHN